MTKTWSLKRMAPTAVRSVRRALAVMFVRSCFLTMVGGSMLGCGIDTEAVAPSVHPSELISYIEPEFRTYNLSTVAPYDTVTLKIRGVSGTGMTLDLPVSFAYDTHYVAISPDGILRAKAKVVSTPVIVTMSNKGATRSDTIRVGVIDTLPRPLARVAIEPNPGDSAKATMIIKRPPRKSLQLIRADSNNVTVTSVLVSIQSSAPSVAVATQAGNAISVTPVKAGRTMLRISTFAYGVGYRDSLAFITGWPLLSYAFIQEKFITGRLTPILSLGGSRIIVGVGACVVWKNLNEELETDIVFDDPSAALPPDSAPLLLRSDCQTNGGVGVSPEGSGRGGNILPFRLQKADGSSDVTSAHRARAFTKPGVYTYRSSTYDFVGTIVVCDERNDPTCAPENYEWGIPER